MQLFSQTPQRILQKHTKMAKQFSPVGRVFIFYFPLSLKWAIAFLPRRLKRAMKTKVFQSCSTQLPIYNKIQHDKIFQENLWSILATLQNFPLRSDFGIQHLETQGEQMCAGKAKQNKNQNRKKKKNNPTTKTVRKTQTTTRAIKHMPE